MFNSIKKLKQILTRREQILFMVLLCAITAMAFMQTIGVASIMPFIALILDPSIIFEQRWLLLIYDGLNFESTNSFIIFTGIVMFVIIFLSNAISAFTIWLKVKISYMNNHRLSRSLMEKYLSMPYHYFLNQNSSELIKNVLSEIDQLTQDFLLPLLEVVSKALLVLFILLVLFWVNIYLSLFVFFIIGGIYIIIYWRVNHKLERLGHERWKTNKLRYKITNEAFGGVKELKVLNREGYFLNEYSSASLKHVRSKSLSEVIGKLPRFALEAVAFGGIIVYSLILLLTQDDARHVIPMVGLFAFAGYRLMPAMQDIFSSFAAMRYSQSAFDRIHHDIVSGLQYDQLNKNKANDLPESLIFQKSIRLENISYNYPNSRFPVICNIDLLIPYNTSVAIVGPTGAGKTTLVDIILGLLDPQNGSIFVDDHLISKANMKNWQACLGYVPQHIYLSDDSIARNIAFGVPDSEIDLAALEQASRLANIDGFIMNELADGFDTIIGERGVRLSGGQRQRIGIARALYHDPAVLIFDEATSALDGITEEVILDALRGIAKLKTLITIAHRLATIKECNMIYILDKGRITARGTYNELIIENKQFKAMAKVK
jgi:ATP-binding cassette, subfamily B, bacterial PglK